MAKNSGSNSRSTTVQHLAPDEVWFIRIMRRSPWHKKLVTSLLELAHVDPDLFAQLENASAGQRRQVLDAVMNTDLEAMSPAEFRMRLRDELSQIQSAQRGATGRLFCGRGEERVR